MIDPDNITKYNRSQEELEELILFCMLVAGKTAHRQKYVLEEFLGIGKKNPFFYIQDLEKKGKLLERLKYCRTGKYETLHDGFLQVSEIKNLKRVRLNTLLKVKGIGLKTAKMFLVHSRKYAAHAVLDTHVLSFMRDSGFKVPDKAPQSKKSYLKYEKIFLNIIPKGYTPASFDQYVWSSRSKREEAYFNQGENNAKLGRK